MAVIVEVVTPGSAAEQAGLQCADRLLTGEGEPFVSPMTVRAYQENAQSDSLVSLRLERSGQIETRRVPLEVLEVQTRPDLEGASLPLYMQARLAQQTLAAQGAPAQQTPATEAHAEEIAVRWIAAAQAAAQAGDAIGAGWLYAQAGAFWSDRERWQEAEEAYGRAQAALEGGEDRAGLIWVWLERGKCCLRTSEFVQARQCYAQAHQASGEAGYPVWEARSLDNLGFIAQQQGDLEAARRYHLQALQIEQQKAPGSLEEAASLSNLGNVALSQGDLESAHRYYLQALQIRQQKAPGSLEEAASLNNLGNVALDQCDLEGACRYHLQALQIRQRKAPGSLEEAGSFSNLGNVAVSQGDLEAAHRYHLQALQIRQRKAPGSLEEALSLSNTGIVAHKQGDLEAAHRYHLQALQIRQRKAPGSLQQAASFNNLGLVAYDRGDLEAARRYHLQALQIKQQKAPGALQEALSLNNLGLIAREQGDLEAARRYHLQALQIEQQKAPGSLHEAASLHNLGLVALDQGDLEEAHRYQRQALQMVQQKAPGALQEAASLYGLGVIAGRQGDLEAARRYHLQALQIEQQKAPGSPDEAKELLELGRIELKQERPDQALPLLTRAAAIVENQRQQIHGPEARTLFLEQHTGVFTSLLATYLALNRLSEAFETLERSRARSLLDSLAERHLDLSAEAPPPLVHQQRQLDQQRCSAYRQLSELDTASQAPQIQSLQAQIASLAVQQRQLTAQMRQQAPRYAAFQYPQSLTLAQVQQTLDPDTTLLEYAVDAQQVSLFAVTSTSLHHYPLPVAAHVLQEQVHRFRSALANNANFYQQACALYDLLVRPAQAQIEPARRLLLCPDGPLHILPFAALIDRRPSPPNPPSSLHQPSSPDASGSERYLIQSKPLHSIVALNVYQQLRQKAAQPRTGPYRVLALGDPVYDTAAPAVQSAAAQFQRMGAHLVPLPVTREQVAEIARLFEPQVQMLLGPEATRSAVLAQAPTARLLHFACHGLLDNMDPLASALALSAEGEDDDGLLRAYEVLEKLKLQAELVVLSACETGLGGESKSEGIVGLTRAFQHAGSQSVLVSLWSIADLSTSRLMVAFYRQLKAGQSKDEALRQAQLQMLADPDYSHPFHWAAFVLTGDGK